MILVKLADASAFSTSIQADDAVAVPRHIVELDTIDTFDLIDENGNRVTTLDPDAAEG